MSNDANALLMGGGRAAKFDQIGTVVTGTVAAEPTAKQQTDFRTGTPETWKDGSPKMQILIQLQTTSRDPGDPSDDGVRTLYVKGKYLTDAVRQAVRAAGASGIHTGGTLTVTYVGDGEQKERGLNPPKLYSASYNPPAVSFAGVTAPAQPAAPVAQQAMPVPAPVAPAASVTPAPAGVDATVWAQLDAEQRARVLAAMAPAANGIPF